NNQAGAAATDIRDQNKTDDVASELTALGFRHVYTAAHATNEHAGTYLAKHFAAVNYSADRSTITGEFKKSPGVLAEDLKGSESALVLRPVHRCRPEPGRFHQDARRAPIPRAG